MCLILFALQQHRDYPLVVIANRDEFYARPTRSAHWWDDEPGLFGGRDLAALGTWMGVSRNGRFAAITNVREPGIKTRPKRSRGHLPHSFLSGSSEPSSFLRRVESHGDDYAGFNLLVGDTRQLWFYSNRSGTIRQIEAGVYGISNGAFDEPWPKLDSGKSALIEALQQPFDDDALFNILGDRRQPDDTQLPDTGVSLEIERLLSSRFIESTDYGTRASSVVKFTQQRQVHFLEQNYHPNHAATVQPRISELFTIED